MVLGGVTWFEGVTRFVRVRLHFRGSRGLRRGHVGRGHIVLGDHMMREITWWGGITR